MPTIRPRAVIYFADAREAQEVIDAATASSCTLQQWIRRRLGLPFLAETRGRKKRPTSPQAPLFEGAELPRAETDRKVG